MAIRVESFASAWSPQPILAILLLPLHVEVKLLPLDELPPPERHGANGTALGAPGTSGVASTSSSGSSGSSRLRPMLVAPFQAPFAATTAVSDMKPRMKGMLAKA